MKKQILNTIVAALFALPLCFAVAQEKGEKGKGKGKGSGKGRPQGRGFQPPKFVDIDTDKSGDISKEEWIAFQIKSAKERAERSFKYVSGDDEKISEEELKKITERFRRGPGGSKGGPGGPKGGGKGPKGKGDPKGGKGEGDTKPKRPPVE